MTTERHTAKKIKPGLYEYRGLFIRRYDNGKMHDPELSGVQWNIYPDALMNGSIEITPTLAEAKAWIDYSFATA